MLRDLYLSWAPEEQPTGTVGHRAASLALKGPAGNFPFRGASQKKDTMFKMSQGGSLVGVGSPS